MCWLDVRGAGSDVFVVLGSPVALAMMASASVDMFLAGAEEFLFFFESGKFLCC